MKVAVVSDIHSNLQAFEAVLEAVADSEAAELWCLGDIVGYGADPDACVELARRHVAVCLAGNHDLAVVGELPLDEFSRGASIAAQWTREVIGPANQSFLAGLHPQGEEHDRMERSASTTPVPATHLGVCALGAACRAVLGPRSTSHLPDRPFPRRLGVYTPGGRGCQRRTVSRDTELDRSSGEWMLNPGSVGQPRDGTAVRLGCC